MKKIILLLMLVMSVSVANAWIKHCDEAVVILASEHLSPKAKGVFDKYLGAKYSDDVQYLYALEKSGKAKHSEEIHYLHLNKKLQPKAKKNDAYGEILKALDVVSKHESTSPAEVTYALRTIINLMCDMHTMANVRIANVPLSFDDFTFQTCASEIGKKKDTIAKAKWSKKWRNYCNYPAGFSAKFRAYDFKIYLGDRFAEYSKGNLTDWAVESGKLAAHYLDMCKPENIVSYSDFRNMDDFNYEQMVKASCRLAKLINETVK
jgi:hypothetical protein